MEPTNEVTVTNEDTVEDNTDPVTVEDAVEEQTAKVDSAVKSAANGTITMDELAAEIRALPEKMADVFKEMNPTPRKTAAETPAKTAAKPAAKPVAAKPVAAPGKRTFADWWTK